MKENVTKYICEQTCVYVCICEHVHIFVSLMCKGIVYAKRSVCVSLSTYVCICVS